MNKKVKTALHWLCAFILLLGEVVVCRAQSPWPVADKDSKPWTRWWWMGSAVDNKNITSLLNEYAKAGFGGVEVVPIYGAKGYEDRYIPYLSQNWMHALDYTVSQASALKMGVVVSVGSGWPIGGPEVTVDDAASKMIVKYDSLKDSYTILTGKTKQMVKRAAPGGEGFTLDHFSKTAIRDYFKKFDKAYGSRSHGVEAFYNDSYEVFGADWTPDFFEEFKKRRGYDLQSVFKDFLANNDSEKTAHIKSDYRETMSDLMLENFSGTFNSWAHSVHSLSLNQAHGSPANLLDMYAAVDIAETETFGSASFDIPGLRKDTDSKRTVEPDPAMLKFASSAGHAMGHRLSSSETFTWLTEHFKTSWSQCKPEVEQVFLSGINHVFYHGTTYSPEDAPWPGWLFYASVNFVPSNSLWPHLKGLNNYIARCQSVLQSGSPDNEIMLYWPVYDAWNNPKGMDMPFRVHNINEWLTPTPFYKDMQRLTQEGYSMDFVSDRMIRETTVHNDQLKVISVGASYSTLLIPRCKLMPVATLQKITDLARSGATIIMQALPVDVPGFNVPDNDRKKFKELIALLSPATGNTEQEIKLGKGRIFILEDIVTALTRSDIHGESLVKTGLQFIRRKIQDGKYYYLVNHTSHAVDSAIDLQSRAASVVIMDPQSGSYGIAPAGAKGNTTRVRIQLQPGEALIVKVSSGKSSLPSWKYVHKIGNSIALNKAWDLQFIQGGLQMPKDRKLLQLQPWTDFTDSSFQSFSGIAAYTTTFVIPGKKADEYLLQLGKVDESAKVWINGQDAGILWSIPFQARVGRYLKPGVNTIRIEVANLMANRIRYMDRHKIAWRNYHEINFVNVNYKDFDASEWEVAPSGLEGPVILEALKTIH